MLKKRMIFTLLYDRDNFMLSRNFSLQKVGNLRWLKKNYNFSQIAFSIDELIILDVSRGQNDREKFLQHVKDLNDECFVPIAAGGGIRSLKQARELLKSGADKVVINSLIPSYDEIIVSIVKEFGSQCVIASLDVKIQDSQYRVFTENGTKLQPEGLSYWIKKTQDLGVGELYLNSMDRDGTGQGYMMELLEHLPSDFSLPLILAGGAGNFYHLADGLADKRVDAVATAHLFNFVGKGLEQARLKLISNGFDLAVWDSSKAKTLKQIFVKS